MSFILDALRKSEHDRERRTLPGLVERPVSGAPPSKLPYVLVGLGILLLVNFVVLGVVLLRAPAPALPLAPGADARAVAPPPAVVAVRRGVESAPRTRPLDSEAADAEPDAYEVRPPPGLRATSDPSLGAERRIVTPSRAAPDRNADRSSERDNERVAAVNDLPEQVAAGLPSFNIDLHVYGDTPAQRFVVLNGQRLREGGQLREGPILDRITPDGAILSFHGHRFLVPRQQ